MGQMTQWAKRSDKGLQSTHARRICNIHAKLAMSGLWKDVLGYKYHTSTVSPRMTEMCMRRHNDKHAKTTGTKVNGKRRNAPATACLCVVLRMRHCSSVVAAAKVWTRRETRPCQKQSEQKSGVEALTCHRMQALRRFNIPTPLLLLHR